MSKWIKAPADAKRELHAQRTACAKVFDLGNGKRRLIQSLKPIHRCDDKGQWHDIDDTIEVRGKRIRAAGISTPAEFHKNAVGYEMGGMSLTLTSLPFVEPTVKDNVVTYAYPALDLRIEFHVRRNSIRCLKRIGSERSPKEFRWKLEGSKEGLHFNLNVQGKDNGDGKTKRDGEPKRQQQRRLEIVTEMNGSEFIERWTGRTRQVDKVTRIAAWVSDCAFPVVIDPPDITEVIANDADDGTDRHGSFYTNETLLVGTIGLNQCHFGCRFRDVAVPQGATIDLAVLKLNAISGSLPSGGGGVLYGYDTDDAVQWDVSVVKPSTVAKTTASTVLPNSDDPGIRSYTVTGIVQEIVNRAGWVSGNDLSLFALTTETEYYTYTTFEDYSAPGGTAKPQLEIDYTEAAPPASIPTGTLGLLHVGV